MSRAEMTYSELLASPDLEKAVRALSDFDLVTVRGWLAQGERCGWPAERVQGVCIIEGCRRYETAIHRELRGFGDVDHGSEVKL